MNDPMSIHSHLYLSGVFDMAGDTPLQLLVDIKTDGVEYADCVSVPDNGYLKFLIEHCHSFWKRWSRCAKGVSCLRSKMGH